MALLLRILLSVALTFVAGCFPTLYTDAQLGEPAQLEASDWNGLWLVEGSEGLKLVRMRLDVPSSQKLAETDNWRECEMSQAGPWTDADLGEIRRHGERYFFLEHSCQGRLATGKPCEYQIMLTLDKAVLMGHFADEARIRRLLDEGKVPGRIELLPSDGSQKQRVVLNPLTDAHYNELFDPFTGAFPVAFFFGVRLPAELDPCGKQAK